MLTDGIAERRNLLVISLLFIAYFYGDGEITSDIINFPFVNIAFRGTTFLGVMIYTLFFWLIFRYWVKHKGKFKKDFPLEYKYVLKSSRFLQNITATKANLPTPKMLGSDDGTCAVANDFTYVNTDKDLKVNYEIHNKTSKQLSKQHNSSVLIKKKDIRIRLFLLQVKTAFTQPSFSDYVVPYLIAFLAFFGFILAPLFHSIIFHLQQWLHC